MASITLEQANARLAGVESKADLIEILNEISVESRGSVDGAKTVLYSGMNRAKIDLLTSDSNIRILDKTDASKFLNTDNEDFADALTRVFKKDNPDFKFYKAMKDQNSALNKFLYSAEDGGAWNTISKRFVADTIGEVTTLIGEKAGIERIFFQTELEA